MKQTAVDFEGKDISIGDTVIFFSAPAHLMKGTVVGVVTVTSRLVLAEIVVTNADGTTHTTRVLPGLCALYPQSL